MSKIICVNGGSGSGKTFLAQLLSNNQSNLPFTIVKAITDCSREPRKGEINGKDYYFRTKEEFEKRISNNEYVEFSLYNGTYRGLRIEELERCLKIPNAIVLLVLDINGVMAIKEKFPNVTTSIYINVSKEMLEKRMRERGDDEENIRERLNYYESANEGANGKKCDYVIMNNGTPEDLKNAFINIAIL
jgi:guanylate kinase